MIKRDFILRLIDRAAEFIMKAAGFHKKGEHEKAAQTIEEAFKSLIGLDANLVAGMSVEDLVTILGQDPGKLVACAKLLEDNETNWEKALTLYLTVHLLPGKADYLDRTQDVHRLLNQLGESGRELPKEVEEFVRRFEASPRQTPAN